jgi:hypothetical protein
MELFKNVAGSLLSFVRIRKNKSKPCRHLAYETLEFRWLFAVGDLRVVNYNVLGFDGSPSADVGKILQAIGSETYNGRMRAVDIVAIQEVQSQLTTTASVVSQLNAIYGSGRYSRGSLNGASTSGNETMGLIFNSQTIQLVSEVGVGTPSSTGAARQPIRYQLRPLELPAGNDFYLYNSHYKASDTDTDRARRNAEAIAIRANADALGQGAHLIYAGDFNTKSSTEASYQTLLGAGFGQAIDPIDRPGNWTGNSSFRSVFTQAPSFNPPTGFVGGGLNDRFDFQLLTSEWTNGTGLEYATNSYHPFANNGSVAVNGSINDASNTALPGMANRSTILNLLTTVTDHLPLVADYFFASNLAPTNIAISGISVAENAPASTLVGTLSTADPNADTHTYSLVSGAGSNDNLGFAIVGNSLRTSNAFALDGTASYSVRIRTTDSGGLSFEKPFTILVTNVPPTLTRSLAIASGAVQTVITNSGTYSDVAADTVTLTADAGSIVNNGNGTWSWSIAPTTAISNQTVTVTAVDEDGGSGSVTFVLNAIVPPKVQSVVFGDGTAQRSMVGEITVDLDSVVSIGTGAFVLERKNGLAWDNLASELSILIATSLFNNNTRATLTFSGAGIVGGSLADGNYRLTVQSAGITKSGVPLDGDGNGIAGDSYVLGESATDNFFRYFGDYDGNRIVNGIDLGRFRRANGTLAGEPEFNSMFDFNGDGIINGIDLGRFRIRNGTLLDF